MDKTDGNCFLQGPMTPPRGSPNLGTCFHWQRPGLCPSGERCRGRCARAGGVSGLGSSERVEGHGGHCLASSVLKKVQVREQGALWLLPGGRTVGARVGLGDQDWSRWGMTGWTRWG